MSSTYSPDLALIAARAATIPSRKGPLAYGTAGFRAKASLPMDYIFYRMGILVSLVAFNNNDIILQLFLILFPYSPFSFISICVGLSS